MKDDELGSGSGKRRRIKRDHLSANEALLNFAPIPPSPGPALPYESRDRERKGAPLPARGGPPYMDDIPYEKGPSSGRVHGSKEGSKVSRREHEQYPFNAILVQVVRFDVHVLSSIAILQYEIQSVS